MGVVLAENEKENLISIPFQVTVRGAVNFGPITVSLDPVHLRNNRRTNSSRGQTTENPALEDERNLPKCACRVCGSVQLRSDLDTYQVFLAQDDKLVHLRSEGAPGGLQSLYCYECGEEIEAGDLGDLSIE